MRNALLALFTLIAIGCTSAPAPQQPQPRPEPQLKQEPLPSARDLLAQRRATHLARLLAYADAGVFPANRVRPGALNVFIDADGHICAAANLMMLDGQGDLVRTTARDNNFVVLGALHDGPLLDWMLSSGFTQEEIAMIQEPYRYEPDPVAERSRLQGVLRGIHAALTANTDKSLDLAVARLDARPDLVAAL